ncbi:MAG TPA: hypothetical protein ENG52_03980 [Nitrososphaeria archaeon]|nr:hypothetical protein [Nitrososphaeria archaeon]
MSEKGEKVVVKPRYLETPKGRIPTYDFALGMLKAVKLLDEITAELEEKLSELEKRETPGLEGLEERVALVEESFKRLEKKLDLELEEINDKLSTLTDAFSELMERVQKLEELLAKG